MPKAYYNEFDKYAAEWLRNLIAAGHIAPGEVDQRSIEDVRPSDLAGFTQCHFFAGVGVWSLALRRAGWPDSRPVWTGSCPCQPFSAAGKGNGFADERHLWPAWFHLIGQRNPDVVFGEQVSSKDADIWVDLVQTDMEALGYAFGAVPFPSAGIGAPHIRDRLYWLADSETKRRQYEQAVAGSNGTLDESGESGKRACCDGNALRPTGPVNGRWSDADWLFCRVEHAEGDGREQWGSESGRGSIAVGCPPSGLAHTPYSAGHGSQSRGIVGQFPQGVGALQTECRPTGPVNGRWSDADWLFCRDGKWRPVEPGTFPLANGAPARVGRLRAYGNAINAEAAIAFIQSYMECRP